MLKKLSDIAYANDARLREITGLISLAELKVEAIKWVEELCTMTNKPDCDMFVAAQSVAVKDWIIHFFGITDQDIEDYANLK